MTALPASAGAVAPRSIAGSGSVTFDRSPFSGFRSEGQSSQGIISFKEYDKGHRQLLISISGPANFPLGQEHPRVVGAPLTVIDADNARGRCRVGSKGQLQVRAPSRDFRTAESVFLTIGDCGLGEAYDDGHAGTHMDLRLNSDPAGASPWSSEFRFTIYTPGARPPKQPKEPKLEIDHRMRSRFLTSLDGLLRFPSSREEIDPPSWVVDFGASPCTKGDYSWTVDGQAFTSHSCHVKVTVSKLGPVDVTVQHGAASGKAREVLRDRLVLGIGDSLASGEGVPDEPADSDHPKAQWGDRQCHRSARSHQALTARAIPRKDPSSSVTFVHLACSGAAFAEGLFGPYKGIEPNAGGTLAGQFFRFNEISGGRRPDVVLMAIGVNHAHFGAVLKYCTVAFQSVRDNCRDSHVVFNPDSGSFSEDSSGPELTEYVRSKLAELPTAYAEVDRQLDALKVKPSRVYIVVYPDPTRERNGTAFCDHFLQAGFGGAGSIDPEDTRWLANGYALPLNAAVLAAARKYHWNAVKGYADEFAEHGYCAGNQRWTVTYDDSSENQGDENGTVHPNYTGHREIAKFEEKAVLHDLFP